MANRPVFIPNENKKSLVRSILVQFNYHSGFSIVQKQKSIDELHLAIQDQLGLSKILEVSSKSKNELGVKLSAFNLKIKDKDKQYSVESAFQGSKVFENGGPFLDILEKTSKEAKKDERLRTSGQLIGFKFYNTVWGLTPFTAFYDWLYINTLNSHTEFHEELLTYDGFTDIEFNPKKSINCQAHALAMFVSIRKQNLTTAIRNPDTFLKLYSNYITNKIIQQNKSLNLQNTLF